MATKRRVSPKELRKKAKKLTIDELYQGGESSNLLSGRFGTAKVYDWFQNRHRRGYERLDHGVYRYEEHEWRVPQSVALCLKRPLTPGQIHVKHAWYVTWVSQKTGNRLRKRFVSPWQAIHFIATRAQYADPNVALVSRTHPYDIPSKYRGKLPHKDDRGRTWYWCPLCMRPRRFFAAKPLQEFYAMKKVWNSEKLRYEYRDRKVRLLECRHCGCTNRETVFRRSNQPWETRKFKKGVTRARRHKKRR